MDGKETAREKLYSLLGDLPDKNRPVSGNTVSEKDCGTYILENLLLDLNGIQSVPAYVAKPKNVFGRLPCVIYNHYHGPVIGEYGVLVAGGVGRTDKTNGRPVLCHGF